MYCQWQFDKQSAVGFRPDLEQSEPGLLSHAFATKLGWDWALSTHFEFLKCLLLFILPSIFFISKGDGLST